MHISSKPASLRIERLGDVDSTNAEAMRRAAAGEEGPLWIVARRQLAGRGRRGRPWVSEPGNLYASLLIKPDCAPRDASQLAFVAALALRDAISGLAPETGGALALKWPNDLLFNGAKVAGILIEAASSTGIELLVIGCGVNCATHPTDTPYAATDFAAQGIDVPADALAEALAAAFARRLEQWQAGKNFTALRADWLKHAYGLRQRITIRSGEGDVSGIFEALGEDGRLDLRLDDGSKRSIFAGDVFFAATSATGRAS